MSQDDNSRDGSEKHGRTASDNIDLKMRSLNILVTVSMIAAFVALIFGSIVLSIVALICTLVSIVRLQRIVKGSADRQSYLGYIRMQRMRVIASLIVSVIALGYSIYAFTTVMPMLTEMLDNGNIEDTIASLKDAASGSASDRIDGGAGSESVFG